MELLFASFGIGMLILTPILLIWQGVLFGRQGNVSSVKVAGFGAVFGAVFSGLAIAALGFAWFPQNAGQITLWAFVIGAFIGLILTGYVATVTRARLHTGAGQ